MKYFYLFLLVMVNISLSFSQSISRSTLCSFGNSIYENNTLIRQTIGQPSNTLVFANDGFLLRQGFQQPFIISSQNTNKEIKFSLHPNPAYGETNISLHNFDKDFTINIFSNTGAFLKQIENINASKYKLDLRGFPPGLYLIQVKYKDLTGVEKLIVSNSQPN